MNNKHVNKVPKPTGRAEAITAGRQQNKQQYLIIHLMKNKESIKTGQERAVALHKKIKQYHVAYLHTTIILTYWYIGRPINVITFDIIDHVNYLKKYFF